MKHYSKILLFFICIFANLFSSEQTSQETTFDTTFNNVGYNLDLLNNRLIGLENTSAHSIGIQSNGNIIIAGQAIDTQTNQLVILIASYTPEGLLYESFGNLGWITTSLGSSAFATAVTIQSDDKIVITGQAIMNGQTPCLITVRYNTNGSVDTSFNANSSTPGIIFLYPLAGETSIIGNDVQVDEYGNIFVVGNNGSSFFFVRYTNQGLTDPFFAQGLPTIVGSGTANSFVLTSDDSFPYIINSVLSYQGSYLLKPVLITNTGVSVFYPNSINISPTTVSFDALLQPDGKFIATGVVNSQIFVARWDDNGYVDTTFGSNGFATLTIPNVTGLTASAINLQQDSKIVVTGYATINAQNNMIFTRFNSNGTPDLTFNNGSAYIIISYQNGIVIYDTSLVLINGNYNKLLVTGQTTNSDSTQMAVTTQFIPVNNQQFTEIDLTFNDNGYNNFTKGQFYGVALQSTGNIIAAGEDGYSNIMIARFTPEGLLDTSFNNGTGYIVTTFGYTSAIANAVTIDLNDKIVITGQVYSSNSTEYSIVTARYNADGSVDTTFNNVGYTIPTDLSRPQSNTAGNGVVIDTASKIVITGAFSGDRLQISRYNSNGSLDLSFNGNGQASKEDYGQTVFDKSVTLYTSYKGYNNIATLYYAYYDNNTGPKESRIFALNNLGYPDNNFSDDGVLVINIPNAQDTIPADIITQPDNNFLVLGSYSLVKDTPPYTIFLARILSNGSYDPSFGTDGTGLIYFSCDTINASNLMPASINFQTNNTILITSSATINGVNEILAIRYNLDGTLDYSFSPTGYIIQSTNSIINSSCLDLNENFIVAGGFGSYVDGSGHSDTYTFVSRFTNFIVDMPTTIETILFNTIPDVSFASSNAMDITSTGKITTAGEAISNNVNYVCLNQYNADGTFNNSFNDGTPLIDFANSFAQNLAIYPPGNFTDKILVVGSIITNSQYGTLVARYSSTGELDPTFNITGYTSYNYSSDSTNGGNAALLYADETSIVLNSYNGDVIITQFSPSGTLDTNFNGDGYFLRSENGRSLTGYDMTFYTDDDNNQNIAVLYVSADGPLVSSRVMALTSAGTINYNFSTDGFLILDYPEAAQTYATAITLQADRQMIVTGSYFLTTDSNVPTIFVVRFNHIGTLDTSFGINGYVTFQLNNAIELHATNVACYSNGKILVTGDVKINNIDQLIALRLNPDGSLDTTFSPSGYIIGNSTSTYIQDSLIQSDEEFIVTGYQNNNIFTSILNTITPNFVQDSLFGINNITELLFTDVQEGQGNTVGQQSTGQLIVAGKSFDQDSELNIVTLRRYNIDGSLDYNFGNGGIITTCFNNADFTIHALAIDTSNRIVVVGQYDPNNPFIIRYTANGLLDSSFNASSSTPGMIIEPGPGVFNVFYDVQIQSDNKIVVCGTSTYAYFAPGVQRYNSDGTIDYNFFEGDGFVQFGGLYGNAKNIIVISNESYLVASELRYNGVDWNIQYASITSPTAFWLSAIYFSSSQKIIIKFIATPDKKYLAAGNVDSSIFLARWNYIGNIDTTFNNGQGYLTYSIPDATLTTLASVQMNSDKILVTGTATINNNNYITFIQFNNDGTEDLTFNNGLSYKIIDSVPNTNVNLADAFIQPDLKWVVTGQYQNLTDNSDQGFFIGRFLGDYQISTSSTTDTTAIINAYGTDPNTIQDFLPIPLYIANTIPASLISTIQATLDIAITDYVQEYISYPQFNFITHLYLLRGYLRTAQLALLATNPDYSQQINLLFYAIRYRINQLTPPSAPKLL